MPSTTKRALSRHPTSSRAGFCPRATDGFLDPFQKNSRRALLRQKELKHSTTLLIQHFIPGSAGSKSIAISRRSHVTTRRIQLEKTSLFSRRKRARGRTVHFLLLLVPLSPSLPTFWTACLGSARPASSCAFHAHGFRLDFVSVGPSSWCRIAEPCLQSSCSFLPPLLLGFLRWSFESVRVTKDACSCIRQGMPCKRAW